MKNINKKLKSVSLLAIFGAAMLSDISLVNAHGYRDGAYEKRPPREARFACEGKVTGASCVINTHNGEKSGTCEPRKRDNLACVPVGRKKQGHYRNVHRRPD